MSGKAEQEARVSRDFITSYHGLGLNRAGSGEDREVDS